MLRNLAAGARTVWFFTVISILTLVMCTGWFLILPITYWFDRDRHLGHFLSGVWARTIVTVQPWWKVRIKGRENLAPKGKAVVYTANHQHESDILMLFLLGTRFRWLSKMSIFYIPWLGWAMWLTGYVGVRRGSHESHLNAKRRSGDFLRRGIPMIFFPEGTFGDGKVLRFKQGAFRLAQETEVPIVPITIIGTRDVARGKWIQPATVDITIHPRIENEGANAVELAERTRVLMESALGMTGSSP